MKRPAFIRNLLENIVRLKSQPSGAFAHVRMAHFETRSGLSGSIIWHFNDDLLVSLSFLD